MHQRTRSLQTLFLCLLLAACVLPLQQRESGVPSGRLTSGPLEHIPSELSIEHFSMMRLSGTGLTLSELSSNNAYTQYAADYWSNGLRISGIMNIPKGTGPFPLIVFNHGHIDPGIYTRGRGLRREQDYLARNGFAVFHTDYRGHGDSDPSPDTERMVYDAGLEYAMDSVNAINAVREADLPQVSTEHVGMLGHSLGGGVTLNILTGRPDAIDAAVLYAPVSSDAWDNFMRWRSEREEGDRTVAAMGTRDGNPDTWNALSSFTYLDNIDDPILLFHGTNDTDVPKEWSDMLASRLVALDKDGEYVEYQGEPHEFGLKWEDFMKRTADFFHKNLAVQVDLSGVPLIDERRVLKKPFGIKITPETSPVQPERFSGYHTGTDFEVSPEEDATLMTVEAVCTGPLSFKWQVDGYGGVAVQDCMYEGQPITVVYGHLFVESIEAPVGTLIIKDDAIGTLGRGFTSETDGERSHLHLSIHRGSQRELRGYVQQESELSVWIDPMMVLGVLE